MTRLFAAGILLLSACRPQPTPAVDTLRSRAPVPAAPAGKSAPRYLDENARRAALARGPVPGYAGDMLEGCNYVVLLTDTLRQAAAARKYFGGRAPGCATGKQPVVRQVRYDFAQLYDWYIGPFMAVW